MKLTRSLLKKIAVGVSGGVDSAVAAWALKIQGHDIHGVFMRNWDSLNESDSGNCTEDTECAVAAWVCRSLDIPFTEMNFVSHYWNDVFQYTLSEYTAGLTPNPDILCNRHIKFGQLAETCRERLGCDWLATGHYARVVSDKSQGTRLLKARDESKDQTFFLSAVPQSALARAIFPLGGLLKSEVREIAEAVGLTKVAHKKDSTGICFIGKRNFQKFISQDRPGRMVDIDTGVVVGDHQGRHHWTLGQRCHLEAITKYYVANKLQDSNDILVASYHHPSLYSTSFVTDPPHWIRGIPPPQLTSQGKVLCEFRFQRGAPLVPCVVSCAEPGSCGVGLSIALKEPLRVITPGQFFTTEKSVWAVPRLSDQVLLSTNSTPHTAKTSYSVYDGTCLPWCAGHWGK
ncbi:hypothetical protein HAZT_HAZT006308 [Hyalella azteca]|uniref:tRNA-5-taurinomethyluridine 2-sulfurtransferase n=1 Tax=Hyalella azteca TaxID=294128 RepID=A0A6A0H5E7_HYAAZ|nr:hypothetical protein HAZT_HAZT006308 [Hyalella azteca]